MKPTQLIMTLARPYFCGEEVQTAEDGAVVGTDNERRLALMEQIADQSEQTRIAEGELAELHDDGSTVLLEPKTAETEEQRALEAAAAAKQADKVKADPPAAQTQIVRKVNGVDTVITDEMLIKAQKIAAADVYLQEAVRAKNEAETKQRELSEKAVLDKKVDDDLAYLQSVRAIQMGTEEEAAAALRKLLDEAKQQAKPAVDATAIAKEVDERLAFTEAVNRFNVEYADVVADPTLLQLAKNRDDNLVRQGDKRPYFERFKETGDMIRTWKSKLVGAQVTASTDASAEAAQTKEQRKQAATATAARAATGRNAPPAQEDNQEESAADVIAAMRKARGQGMRH